MRDSVSRPAPNGRRGRRPRTRGSALPVGLVWLGFLIGAAAAQTVVLDRIAVTVGNDVITESEVEQEIRVTAFLNRAGLDLSPTARRQAAERLVDQNLVRRDMQLSSWPQPEASEADKIFTEVKRERFRSDPEYRQALAQYGIAEVELKQHLLWQLAALRYTDFRFDQNTVATGKVLREHLERETETRSASNARKAQTREQGQIRLGAAREAQPRTDEDGSAAPQPRLSPPASAEAKKAVPENIDQQMDAWLKEARLRARIVYHEEVFR